MKIGERKGKARRPEFEPNPGDIVQYLSGAYNGRCLYNADLDRFQTVMGRNGGLRKNDIATVISKQVQGEGHNWDVYYLCSTHEGLGWYHLFKDQFRWVVRT